MATKKKKNSNYVTAKTEEARLAREKAALAKAKRKLAIIISAIILCAALLASAVIGIVYLVRSSNPFEVTHHASIVIKDYGTIHVELYGKEAPKTVENFVNLANQGAYNGTSFHRIIKGFMAQGGYGASSGTTVVGEFENNGYENNVELSRGAIAMARADDPDSASAQFFIVQNTERGMKLQGDYAGFGRVTSGMDIIDKICNESKPYDNNGSILPGNQPIITSISIHAAH